MNEEEKSKLAEAMFFDMIRILLSPNQMKHLSSPDKWEIAHSALANLIGAFFVPESEDDISTDEPMEQLFKDAKLCRKAWGKKKNMMANE